MFCFLFLIAANPTPNVETADKAAKPAIELEFVSGNCLDVDSCFLGSSCFVGFTDWETTSGSIFSTSSIFGKSTFFWTSFFLIKSIILRVWTLSVLSPLSYNLTNPSSVISTTLSGFSDLTFSRTNSFSLSVNFSGFSTTTLSLGVFTFVW